MVASVTDGQDQFDRLRVIVTEHVGGRVPMGHFRVDRIPRNEMGKPLRQTLAAMLKHQLVKKKLTAPLRNVPAHQGTSDSMCIQ